MIQIKFGFPGTLHGVRPVLEVTCTQGYKKQPRQ
jgi:hypothetical protein